MTPSRHASIAQGTPAPHEYPARVNVGSGVHTRLGAEVISRGQRVDGLIVWDMLCGTAARPCPKLEVDETRGTAIVKDHVFSRASKPSI